VNYSSYLILIILLQIKSAQLKFYYRLFQLFRNFLKTSLKIYLTWITHLIPRKDSFPIFLVKKFVLNSQLNMYVTQKCKVFSPMNKKLLGQFWNQEFQGYYLHTFSCSSQHKIFYLKLIKWLDSKVSVTLWTLQAI